MDPNIMKFLEEDEDETMHSGADVDAFTAQLNRDIEGNSSTSQQPSDSDSASQFLPQWQTSATDGIANFQSGQDIMATEQTDQHSSQLMLQRHDSDSFPPKEEDSFSHELNSLRFPNTQSETSFPTQQDNQNTFAVSQPMTVAMQNPDHEPKAERDAQLQNLKNMSGQHTQSMAIGSNNQQFVVNDQKPLSTAAGNQQTSIGNQDMSTMNEHNTGMGMNSQQSIMSGTSSFQQPAGTSMRNKQVPFGMLLPIIQPQLDKDRAMQLQTLYIKLKKNEITKDDFVRHMRSIVGDQMLKMAVYKLQTQAANQQSANQFQPQTQASVRQPQVSSTGTNPSLQMPTNLTNPTRDSNTVNSREVENKADLQVAQVTQMANSSLSAFSQDRNHPVFPSAINKQQTHFPQSSFPNYGSGYQPFSAASSPPIRAQPHDSQIRQPTPHQSMSYVKQEPLDQSNEHKTQFPSAQGPSSLSHVKQGNAAQGNLTDDSFEMHSSRMGSAPPFNMSNSRMTSLTSNAGPPKAPPPRKHVVGQKKPMETPGSSPPSSKKQKPSGGVLDQSIEQLNDVTAVSGVNLREEEEQLFSGSKEDSRISEISRRIVQEEEEKLILQKIPLQKKVVELMAKSGLKSMGSDVERCLSLCVEERMRGLIANLIRLSKQRVDMEKPRHRTIITSDVRHQILTINRKAREELVKKQAETDKSLTDPESGAIGEGDKEKDEARLKSAKANKEEDDKMRATAANVAVRAATGVGDMFSRWQLMAEAKQKQGGGTDSTSSSPSGSQPGKDVAQKTLAISSTRNTKESREPEKRDPFNTPGSVRKVGRNQVIARHVARSITVKDVISILEREPQMSKSTLIYCLYDKISASDAPPAND